MSDSFRPPARLLCARNSSGQNTEVRFSMDLPNPGIFPTQGSNLGLPHCRQVLYHLSHQGSPRILEWAAYPFSMGSSWPRNQTRVSCIAGGFFTSWATREAHFIDPTHHVFKVKVKVIQSRPTLCNPKVYTVHGIFQARILEWAAFPFFGGSSWPRGGTQVSCIAGRFFPV